MKKHFNKNLIMSKEEEHLFQQSNSCWICENFFRGAVHWSCNINFQSTKKVPVIFHNLRRLWQSFNFL